MRTCQCCGRENPDDHDFCQCGEYLRWHPGFVEGTRPASAAVASPHGETGASAAAARAAPLAPAAGAPPASAAEPEHERATITLRLPDEDAVKGQTLALGVHPGDRARVRALIRNQSGIVDNYHRPTFDPHGHVLVIVRDAGSGSRAGVLCFTPVPANGAVPHCHATNPEWAFGRPAWSPVGTKLMALAQRRTDTIYTRIVPFEREGANRSVAGGFRVAQHGDLVDSVGRRCRSTQNTLGMD